MTSYITMFRKEAGLHQRELAELLGCKDETTVVRHEGGHRVPTLDVALHYSAALGVEVSELFLGRYEAARRAVAARAWELLLKLKEENPERHRAIGSLQSLVEDPDIHLALCEED